MLAMVCIPRLPPFLVFVRRFLTLLQFLSIIAFCRSLGRIDPWHVCHYILRYNVSAWSLLPL
jgi:hypothetical protein